jgi:hypothetical protein
MSKRHFPRKAGVWRNWRECQRFCFSQFSYDCLDLDSPWNEGPDRVGEPCDIPEVGHPIYQNVMNENQKANLRPWAAEMNVKNLIESESEISRNCDKLNS